MTREDLIKKWLDHDLNPQELDAFKALEDHAELTRLDRNLKAFKAPDFASSETLKDVLDRSVRDSNRIQWRSLAIKIVT